jgi:hypothetical protein
MLLRTVRRPGRPDSSKPFQSRGKQGCSTSTIDPIPMLPVNSSKLGILHFPFSISSSVLHYPRIPISICHLPSAICHCHQPSGSYFVYPHPTKESRWPVIIVADTPADRHQLNFPSHYRVAWRKSWTAPFPPSTLPPFHA